MANEPIFQLSKTEHALMREGWKADGRLRAFSFAVQCHANIASIRDEIESEETNLQEVLANAAYGNSNPMTPGSSPRIYRDAYIAGLREALTLIQGMRAAETSELRNADITD